MKNFGHYCLFFLFFLSSLLLIFQLSSATVIITETEADDEPSLNNETASASSCYCNCAPIITVSCPAAPPPTCPTTTDPPTHPSSTTNPSTSPVTGPLTTAGSRPTVTIITGPTASTFTSSGSTIMSVTSPSTSTNSTITGMTSTSSNITGPTTPVSSSSTILTTPASTSPPSSATSTSTQQSTISTTPSSKNCSAVLDSDSGWFTSPNYPDNYDNDVYCNWLINVTDKIVLTFQFFMTESGYDFVSVYDGPTTASYRLLYASGSAIPPPTNSSGGQMLITFNTDSSNVYKGFNATYSNVNGASSSSPATSTPSTSTTYVDGSTKSTLSTDPDFTRPTTSGPILDNCQAILEGDSGSFSSPYYPQNYPNNANCSWIITAGDRITITFNQFRTESSNDVLKIYDGPTASSSRLLTASGPTIPSAVTSSGSQVLITFFSDGSVNDIGFEASYSLPPTTTAPPYYYCGGNITDVNSGFITSPNFPDGYPAYSRCTWIVQTEPGTRIQFHFTDFSTQPGDYVTVYNDKSCTDDRYSIIKQSGNVSSICGFVTNSNSLKIIFNSGASSSSTLYPGFRASFTTDHGCDGTLNNTNQGVIKSPGYDINGTFSYSCSWKLGVNQGSKLNFSISEMMGYEPSMGFYEGYGNSYQLASGRPTSSFFAVSRSNQVSLYFSSGYTCSSCSCSSTNSVCQTAGVNNGKWKGSYSATTHPSYGCYGSMNTETKTVTSPGYPSAYTQRSLECNWKIEEPAGKKLQLSFPVPVSLFKDPRGYSYYDTLTISNPPWTLTINGGTVNPAPVEIASNETSLYFDTYSSIDNSSLYSGWKINWNAVSSP